jgi:hypothetical protein
MNNPIQAFREMTFKLPAPKQSAQARYRELTFAIVKSTLLFQEALMVFHRSFGDLPQEWAAACAIDQSLIAYLQSNRVVVRCAGNQALAIVGAARLSLHHASQLFIAGDYGRSCTGQQLHDARYSRTSEAHLASIYDALFGDREIIVRWKDAGQTSGPSARQKAQFIEALVGALELATLPYQCNMFCDHILGTKSVE